MDFPFLRIALKTVEKVITAIEPTPAFQRRIGSLKKKKNNSALRNG